jgi:hypothetical protein
MMLHEVFGKAIGQMTIEGIERRRLIARNISFITSRAQRSRDHHFFDASITGGIQKVHGPNDIGVKDFPTMGCIPFNSRYMRSTVINLSATGNRVAEGLRIPEISFEYLEFEAIKGSIISAWTNQRPDRMSLVKKSADKIGTEMAGTPGNQDRSRTHLVLN